MAHRFVVTNGPDCYWGNVCWVGSQSAAVLFKDLDDASRVCCMLRRQEREENAARRFKTTVTVMMNSDRFVDLDELRDVILRATDVFIDLQEVPDDIQIGLRFDWDDLKEMEESA